MSIKIKKAISLFTVLLLMGAMVAINRTPANAISKDIDSYINTIMDDVQNDYDSNPALGLSSNPYDYVKNNNSYNQIVKLGVSAIPVLEQKINDSNENGLKEYIMAIAAEQIAKVDLKTNGEGWSNAKSWSKEWDRHLKTIPTKVSEIISSNDSISIKADNLKKLGIVATPYIMDSVQKGNSELVPVLESLMDESSSNDNLLYNSNKVSNITDWLTQNKDKIENIRKMVENSK